MKDSNIGKRIIILGPSGSGKSTFSRKLHDLLSLPLIHLDNIWWKEDKTHITRKQFDQKLEEILQGEKWIIDGDYSRTYEVRFKACDTVIFLDYDKKSCLAGISERIGKKREDIPWIEDKLDPGLVELINNYEAKNRPIIYQLMEKYPDKRAIIFKDRNQARQWLKDLAQC